MDIAVGTSSAMVAVTVLMDFMGHTINGDFYPQYAIPFIAVAIAGGLIGNKYALKSRPGNLNRFFAVTNLVAALIMIISLFYK